MIVNKSISKLCRFTVFAAAFAGLLASGCAKHELKAPGNHHDSAAVWTSFRGNAPGAAGVADEAVAPPLGVLWSYDAVYAPNVMQLEDMPVEGADAQTAEDFVPLMGATDTAAPEAEPAPGSEKVELKDPIRSSPVVSGGIVVFGTQGGSVLAFDDETGALLWRFTTGDTVFASPLILNGVVYIGSMDHRMYALDLKTGRNIMKTGGEKEPGFEVNRGIKGGAATDGKNIYFGALDKSVYAVDAESLKLKWSFESGDWIEGAPSVANGVVYVGSNDGFMYALSAEDGKMLWNFETGDCVYSTPSVVDGVVYFSSWDGHVYALDAVSGALEWKTKIDDQVSASTVVSGGRVYVGSAFIKGDLVALDAASGAEVWRTPSRGGGYDAAPVLSGNVLYVGSYDMYLYAYDAGTGRLLWEKLMKEWVRGSVAVANNTVFVGAGNGKFLALVPVN